MIKGQSLTQKLATLDRERKAIILEIKKSPQYVLQHLGQILTSFVAENTTKWFSRSNDKNQVSHYRLISYELVPIEKRQTTPNPYRGRLTRPEIESSSPLEVTKNKSYIAKVKTKWEVYAYGAVIKTTIEEVHDISVFNDLDGQILNGRKLATKFDEKKMIKEDLSERKRMLEEELKKVKADIASI